MENNNKANLENLKEVVNRLHKPTQVVAWNGLDINVQHTLSFKDMLTFVNNVFQLCFDGETGEFMPELKDFAIKSYILEMYTDIELPDNVQEKYDLIYCSDVLECILPYVHSAQLSEMIHSVEDKMKHHAQANIEAINMQMNTLFGAFESLQKQCTQMFEGFSGDEVSKLLSMMASGGIDEEKLAKAVLERSEDSSKIIPMPKTNGDTND